MLKELLDRVWGRRRRKQRRKKKGGGEVGVLDSQILTSTLVLKSKKLKLLGFSRPPIFPLFIHYYPSIIFFLSPSYP